METLYAVLTQNMPAGCKPLKYVLMFSSQSVFPHALGNPPTGFCYILSNIISFQDKLCLRSALQAKEAVSNICATLVS